MRDELGDVDKYEIIINDITGMPVFRKSYLKSTNCTFLNPSLFYMTRCGPYSVSVRAINAFGFSDTNQTIGLNNNSLPVFGQRSSAVCSCLTKKGNSSVYTHTSII